MTKKNTLSSRKFFIILTVLVGIIFSIKFDVKNIYASDDKKLEQFKRFLMIYNILEQYHFESPNLEKIIDYAIKGVLKEFDPNSDYIPKEILDIRTGADTEGFFWGIGIEFQIKDKLITVTSSITGGPADAVGIRFGDQILRINGQLVYDLNEDEAMRKLNGSIGSKVKLTIRRPGALIPFEATVNRFRIPIQSVLSSFILNDGETGYICIARFNRTTSQEVEQALKDLEVKGMKQLILDLRGNTGGYLDQAAKVVDNFVPGGYKIVYTRGRIAEANDDFFSTKANTHSLYPLVVMIDRATASGAEIVAGAIQDLDRGLVVGEKSFGLGMIQSQFALRDGSALRLTIAHYYTPSGRDLQKLHSEDSIGFHYVSEDDSGKFIQTDSTKIFFTLAGRKVYGGGGIIPDISLNFEEPTPFIDKLLRENVFYELGSIYATAHPNMISSFEDFRANFIIDKEILSEFRELVESRKIEFTREILDSDMKLIKLLLKAEIARSYWGLSEYHTIRMLATPELKKIADLMPKAKEIMRLHKW